MAEGSEERSSGATRVRGYRQAPEASPHHTTVRAAQLTAPHPDFYTLQEVKLQT